MPRTRGALLTIALLLLAVPALPGAGRAAMPVSPRTGAAKLDCWRGDGTFKIRSRTVDARTPAAMWQIEADVKNTSKKWRGKVRGQVCFYNARGKLIGNEWAPADQLVFAPHARGPWVLATDAPAGFDHYTVRFTSKKSKLRTVRHHVKVTTHDVHVGDTGSLVVPIKVRNRNPFTIRHVAVYATLFNAKGRIVSSDDPLTNYTRPSKLRPGQVGKYEAHSFLHRKGADHVRIQVEAFR